MDGDAASARPNGELLQLHVIYLHRVGLLRHHDVEVTDVRAEQILVMVGSVQIGSQISNIYGLLLM